MIGSIIRVNAMFRRYLYLHKRSLPRTLEILFWPVMELLVWGFVATYVQGIVQDGLSRLILFLINAMIFWDILYRSQQAVSISFMEDIWTQNIVNLLISPLKIWEWHMATFLYGLAKSIVITLILGLIALGLYRFNLIAETHWFLLPLVANLFLFGWAIGVATSGLLVRWGYAAEALIWGIPFLIQPLSAIYYPLETLPVWLRPFALALPSTYVFEGMREVIRTGSMPFTHLFCAFGLNILYFILGSLFFTSMFRFSRNKGRLGHLGMD